MPRRDIRVPHPCVLAVAVWIALTTTPLCAGEPDPLPPRLGGPVQSFYENGRALSAPDAQAVGDVNGDGVLDVVALVSMDWEELPGTTQVMLGDTSGRFTPAGTLNILDVSGRLGLGDLTGDGRLDLVAKNQNRVELWPGDGAGGFAPGGPTATLPATCCYETLQLLDVDADGDLDALLKSDIVTSDDAVWFVRNLGGGVLDAPANVHTQPADFTARAGDLDGDGLPDLVLYGLLTGSLDVRLGTGGGAFGPRMPQATLSGLREVRLADVDRDGDLDVLLFGLDGLRLLPNDGNGALGAATTLLPGTRIQAVAVTDLDADGLDDLALAVDLAPLPFSDEALLTLPGLGGGLFGAVDQELALSASGGRLEVFDANGDGAPELLRTSPDLQAVFFDAEGRLRPRPDARFAAAGQTYTGLELLDDDLDGAADLVRLSTRDGDMQVEVRRGLGDADFAAPFDALVYAERSGWRMRSARVDADPLDDLLLISSPTPWTLHTVLALPGGGYAAGPELPLPNPVDGFTTGDVDGDGDADVVLAHFASSIDVRVLLGDGAGAFVDTASFTPTDITPDLFLLDLVGDAADDLLLVGDSIVLRESLGGGAFGPPTVLAADTGSEDAALADLDADGDLDLLSFRRMVVLDDIVWELRVHESLGGGAFLPPVVVPTPPRYPLFGPVEVADLDEDGHRDLLVAGGQLELRGDGALGFVPQPSSVSFSSEAAFADLDADGFVEAVLGDIGSTTVYPGRPPTGWSGAGQGLAGSQGVPSLRGLGSLADGGAITLALSDAQPGAPASLVLGLSAIQAPFKGGVLVPSPDLILPPQVTNPLGLAAVGLPVVPGLTGLELWWQSWVADSAGPRGFAASNALSSRFL